MHDYLLSIVIHMIAQNVLHTVHYDLGCAMTCDGSACKQSNMNCSMPHAPESAVVVVMGRFNEFLCLSHFNLT